MNGNLYQNLFDEGLISEASLMKITQKEKETPLFSIHWEIKTVLYIGVLMFTGGLGLLIYRNIESIGHQFVLLFIALICVGCFVYCFNKSQRFSRVKVESPNAAFDYILLLGSITMLIFVGYLQYQYKVFGTHYGTVAFIPMVALFFIAYYFDHLGILSMAIANLAVWMGVSVTPKQLLLHSDFNSETIIYTYLLLGVVLVISALLTQRYNIKKHFKFSYQHYGIHITYIALLAGYFHFYNSIFAAICMLGAVLLSILMYFDAFKSGSFYFLLLVILYSYIALSCLSVRLFTTMSFLSGSDIGVELMLIYFTGSAAGFLSLLVYLNKKLKAS